MPTIKDLTIAILTHQRPAQLKSLLSSLHQQTHQPSKYIILKSSQTIPQKRNQAIKQCRTQYLAFIDDDCLPHKDWIYQSHLYISSHNNLPYVVGKTNLQNPDSSLSRLHFKYYQEYFYPYHPLDTKNVIFDLTKIDGIKFDTSFDIFEDVDFHRQLLSKKIAGGYNPKMIVTHPEPNNIFLALKKKYRQGIYKAKINSKWGNFDNFNPSFPSTKNLFDFLLKLAFNLGYIFHPPKLITIVNHFDSGANQQRLRQFQKHYLEKNYTPTIVNSHAEFQKVIASRRYLLSYGWPLLKYRLLKQFYQSKNLEFYSALLPLTMRLKQTILHRLLQQNFTSLAIIQYPEDMLVSLVKRRQYQVLYDSPTIFYHELELSRNFPQKTINFLEKKEKRVYQLSDFVSFHWYTYFNIAKKLGLKINHPLKLNWPSEPSNKVCQYSSKPRIVYLGILNSYWVNPQLLIELSKQHPINVYSYQTPDPKLYPPGSINFCGYLKDLSDLSKYQFGLITLSTDHFRSQGFSAKHIDYINHGLPVLCPEWRHDTTLSPSTIPYTINNFQFQIKKHSHKKHWATVHQQSLLLSKQLVPDNTLNSLLNLQQSIFSEVHPPQDLPKIPNPQDTLP